VILFFFFLVSVSYYRKQAIQTMQSQTQSAQSAEQQQQQQPLDILQQPLDILQQFDVLLKTHSIVVHDRETLTKLFECIVDLCTQMPKAKLKAAVKAATQEPKPKAVKETKPKAQPKTKAVKETKPKETKPKTNAQEIMVGPEGAADAPVSSDLQNAPVARGRGRPRKTPALADGDVVPVKTADANPNAETAEKKRRGRPKKDKSVTISSNDDEDALIEQMMADVASMQKDPVVVESVLVASPVASAFQDDDDTESECEMSPKVQEMQQTTLTFAVEADVPSNTTKANKVTKAVKEVKPKAVKEVKPKAVKEVKPKAVKEVVKPVVETNEQTNAQLASFSKPMPQAVIPKTENHEVNGSIYLHPNFPASSFTWNGKTYLRTELDNVYDNLTLEMVGVWDHANHEVISAFDDEDDMCFSDEE
jgi:hypothetical protein